MSTGFCKMCIGRFIARRVAPVELYSDNGTNFHGAASELQKQIQKANQDSAKTFTATKMYFNPPAAPHMAMGGVLELLEHSVKVVLQSMNFVPRVPVDETFETMILAESMMN